MIVIECDGDRENRTFVCVEDAGAVMTVAAEDDEGGESHQAAAGPPPWWSCEPTREDDDPLLLAGGGIFVAASPSSSAVDREAGANLSEALCPDAVTNVTTLVAGPPPEFEHVALFVLLLSFSLATVLGNILVILAVLRTRSLHSATNYFITSLAVADGLVGLVVMPFSAAYEAMDQQWVFGADWCDVWHSLDVLASTASILNLCVISLDRYWAITNPITYPCKMSDTRASLLILLVWICSSAISFPAILWWRAVASGPPPAWQCPFTEDTGYLVFSSTVSFYGPLTVMVFTYVRIYRAAVAHMKNIRSGAKRLQGGAGELRIHRGGGGGTIRCAGSSSASLSASMPHQTGLGVDARRYSSHSYNGMAAGNGKGMLVSSANNVPKVSLSKKMKSFAKEKKAAKTLGTVMGVFIICWLPFFVTNVISGMCADCITHPAVFQVVTWLGWINSGMNPVIYACCSKEFRRAFARILCYCCRRHKNSRGSSNRSFAATEDDPSSETRTNRGRGSGRGRLAEAWHRVFGKCCKRDSEDGFRVTYSPSSTNRQSVAVAITPPVTPSPINSNNHSLRVAAGPKVGVGGAASGAKTPSTPSPRSNGHAHHVLCSTHLKRAVSASTVKVDSCTSASAQVSRSSGAQQEQLQTADSGSCERHRLLQQQLHLAVSGHSLYSIPPPNYFKDPSHSAEKLF